MQVPIPIISWKKSILLGILIRFLFSFWTGNPSDFEIFIRLGYYVAHGVNPNEAKLFYVEGLGQPTYPYVSGIGYPPAWGLCTALAYNIYQLLPFSPFFYYVLLKIFPIFGDLATTYIIFLLIKRNTLDIRRAEETSMIFFMCPFVIFISSIWGMFDSISIFLTLLSILLLLSDKPYWSAFALGLGIYFKIIPIIYLPIQLIFIGKDKGAKVSIKYLLICSGTPIALTLIPTISFGWKVSEIGITVLSQTIKMGEGITYWNLFSLLRELYPNIFTEELLNAFFSFPPIRYLWILGLIACYISYFKYIKQTSKNLDKDNFFIISKWYSITMISFLLTWTFISEQLVLYIISTMTLMLGILYNNSFKRYYFYIWVLTLAFSLVNLYPFAFAYLLDIKFWNIFNYLAYVKPFSTLRFTARFILAIFFNYYMFRSLEHMVKKE